MRDSLRRFLKNPREWVGVVLKDWRRFERGLRDPGPSYLALCNRNEALSPAPDGSGWRCEWRWTSDLHAPKYMPSLGSRLMARAFADHPIARAAAPRQSNSDRPDVSFIVCHRGEARLPHLLATLSSIAGQAGAAVECIVVEQDDQPRVRDRLPPWVRHVHTPPPQADLPFCRSWALNVGARHARAPVLVLQDNDLLVPRDYAATARNLFKRGYELMNLKRFIFYLDAEHSRQLAADGAQLLAHTPESITQNNEGGTIAIAADAFERIGGMDESFIGWGGEDNEFWERGSHTLKTWPWGCLPIAHLWHAPQPGKWQPAHEPVARYQRLSQVDVPARIADLRTRAWGSEAGPQAGDARSSQPHTAQVPA